MNFDFTDDQGEIKRTARDILSRRSPMERVRAAAEARHYDMELWHELVALGWPGIAIAEEHGGQGLGMVELVILLEELGYAVTAVPFLATVSGALVLAQAGSPAQRSRWLPQLASGEATAALGIAQDGVGALVPDGDSADVVVLVEDGAARLVLRSQADVSIVETIDPTRRYARVSGEGEPLPGPAALGLAGATVAVAAELVGICQRSLEMTLEYVRERKQFGSPVGAFQAVSHRCAAMFLDTESARSTTLFAAWAADAQPDRLPEGASLAKAAASQAGRDVTASAIQAHGGIGFTWEADVHWLYKRAQLDAALFGGTREHRARLAELVARRLSLARV